MDRPCGSQSLLAGGPHLVGSLRRAIKYTSRAATRQRMHNLQRSHHTLIDVSTNSTTHGITATDTNSLSQPPNNYTEVKEEGRSWDPHRSLYRMLSAAANAPERKQKETAPSSRWRTSSEVHHPGKYATHVGSQTPRRSLREDSFSASSAHTYPSHWAQATPRARRT